jgi:hypothetical protein
LITRRGAHDDLINAAAGAIVTASRAAVNVVPIVGALIYSPSTGWSDAAAKPRTDWYYGGGGDGGFRAIGGPTLGPPPGSGRRAW